MTRTNFLLQKIGEHKVGQETFMKRLCYDYADDLPTKLDFVRYFLQLQTLYRALESRLEQLSDAPLLAIFRELPFAGRSVLLDLDIKEMMTHLNQQERHLLTKKAQAENITSSFIQHYIEKADVGTLFAFLAVRCLGDCHGGQSLSTKCATTFLEELQGNVFFKGIAQATASLYTAVNNKEMDENDELAFQEAVDSIFEYHGALFQTLEKDRKGYHAPSCGKLYPYVRSHATFFAMAGVTTAIAATVGVMNQL